MPELMPEDTAVVALPHSVEAERSVLGAVLLDNHQFHQAQEVLTSGAFYSTRHRKIFLAMETLMDAGSAVIARRSSSGLREQAPAARQSGSMWIARPGK